MLQVELAQMEYLKSRLVRRWTHVERQRGAPGFVGGSGETQIESDRARSMLKFLVEVGVASLESCARGFKTNQGSNTMKNHATSTRAVTVT